jgi:ABC-type nitrate/sulfonate/bicarbonate transport system substrate-binding protein
MHRAFAALAALLMAGVAGAQAAETVTAGAIGSPSGTLWPFFIGVDKGFYAEAGITLDLVYAPTTGGVIQQLSAGSLDIVASTGLPEPINAIDKGAPIAIARIVAQANPYGMVGKPSIKRLEDLKGKIVSLGGVTDITSIYWRRMISAHGMAPTDFDILVVGATGARLAGVESGAVDATMLLPPVLFKAKEAGLTDLGLTIDYTRDLPFTGLEVNRSWATAHLDLAKRSLAAYDTSVKWFLDDKNRDEAIAILGKATKLGQSDLDQTYDMFRKIAFFAPAPTVSRALLEGLMRAQIEVGDRQTMVPVDRLVMPSLTQFAG